MSSEDGVAEINTALTDELEALNSIYGPETLKIQKRDVQQVDAVLKLPDLPFSFLISFPSDYPDVPPIITGTQSTGGSGRGEGEAAVNLLRGVLGEIYQPGIVCLFDLVEEVKPRLEESRSESHGTFEDNDQDAAHRSGSQLQEDYFEQDLTSDAAASMPPPPWVLSDPLTVNKSTFIARACPVASLSDATDSISHLLATNKKVAGATHNITAWRIQSTSQAGPVTTTQDCDDDGETAAGGRLLHLMQLMDVWNVVVVVTRWYGGVKLGPDRFRLINQVAREALVKGGFAKEEADKSKGKGKGKK